MLRIRHVADNPHRFSASRLLGSGLLALLALGYVGWCLSTGRARMPSGRRGSGRTKIVRRETQPQKFWLVLSIPLAAGSVMLWVAVSDLVLLALGRTGDAVGPAVLGGRRRVVSRRRVSTDADGLPVDLPPDVRRQLADQLAEQPSGARVIRTTRITWTDAATGETRTADCLDDVPPEIRAAIEARLRDAGRE